MYFCIIILQTTVILFIVEYCFKISDVYCILPTVILTLDPNPGVVITVYGITFRVKCIWVQVIQMPFYYTYLMVLSV